MAYEVPVLKSATRNTIKIAHPKLLDFPTTNINTAVSSTGTVLTVIDNTGFATLDYIVIGELNLNSTEIKQIDAAVTAGIYLGITALTFDHPVDTKISKILWNQVEISGANTTTGAKTSITTINLQPDRDFTTYVNAGTTYAYYFIRYYNSTSAKYSEYSDASPASGFTTNTVRSVKDSALSMVNERVTDLISDDFLNTEIVNCEQEIYAEKKRWSYWYETNYIIGNTVEGKLSYALPTNISDPNSPKSILSVHIASEHDLDWIDTQEMNRKHIDITYNNLASDVALVDVTVTLVDSSDLADSGTVTIADDEITYTANDRATGILSGVTGITSTHTAGDYVWQNTNFGQPLYYSISNGYIYFDIAPNSDFASKNIYISYYKKPTFPDSDADLLVIADPTVYHYYLAWKILLKKNNGKDTEESEMKRKLYEARKDRLKKADNTGQRIRLRPRLNTIRYVNSQDVRIVLR